MAQVAGTVQVQSLAREILNATGLTKKKKKKKKKERGRKKGRKKRREKGKERMKKERKKEREKEKNSLSWKTKYSKPTCQ